MEVFEYYAKEFEWYFLDNAEPKVFEKENDRILPFVR